MTHALYLLYRSGVIRYVGVTDNPVRRLLHHVYESMDVNGRSYHLPKSRWIRKVQGDVKMRVVFRGSESECYAKEPHLIRRGRERGWPLLNLSEGGDRPPRINQLPQFAAIVEKIRSRAVGRCIADRTRQRMSASHKRNASNIRRLRQFQGEGHLNPHSKKVYQLSPSGSLVRVWDCGRYAARAIGMSPASLSDALHGRQTLLAGYRWSLIPPPVSP